MAKSNGKVGLIKTFQEAKFVSAEDVLALYRSQ
jgi:hypothetical protein